ncbi:MAG: nucleoside-diphosphate kinase [Elusimicrobia bacterium]|nr:nucleoside-diphosphate kinase [Elusimicrobiota bacterium]
MVEHTLVLIKPDGLKRLLTGSILTKLAGAQLMIIGAKVVRVDENLARQHYRHLSDKPFFDELVKYITGDIHGEEFSRILAFVYRGEDAIAKIRKITGATNPEEADPTSIRGSFGRITTTGVFENVVHSSGTPEEAEREIKLWFQPREIVCNIYPVRETESGIIWAWPDN